jgi:NOL1/NOP2/fmu family ribosome biogenesis protein
MFLQQKKFSFHFFHFFLSDRSFLGFGAVAREGIVLANYHLKGIATSHNLGIRKKIYSKMNWK